MGRRDLTLEDVEKAVRAAYSLGELEFLNQKHKELQEILSQLIDEIEYPDVPESVRKFIRDLENQGSLRSEKT